MLGEFLEWLKECRPELLPLTLTTGKWAERVLENGWCESDTKWLQEKHRWAIAPLLEEFMDGR